MPLSVLRWSKYNRRLDPNRPTGHDPKHRLEMIDGSTVIRFALNHYPTGHHVARSDAITSDRAAKRAGAMPANTQMIVVTAMAAKIVPVGMRNGL